MSENLSNVIVLEIGDSSGDGHDKRNTVVVVSNKSQSEIMEAYRKGCAVVGFDLINECCEEFEDSLISEARMKMLTDAGVKLEDDDFVCKNGFARLSCDEWTTLYLGVVSLGFVDPSDFKYEILNYKHRIYIGGYGLFNF
jgi:hypothetical protein